MPKLKWSGNLRAMEEHRRAVIQHPIKLKKKKRRKKNRWKKFLRARRRVRRISTPVPAAVNAQNRHMDAISRQ